MILLEGVSSPRIGMIINDTETKRDYPLALLEKKASGKTTIFLFDPSTSRKEFYIEVDELITPISIKHGYKHNFTGFILGFERFVPSPITLKYLLQVITYAYSFPAFYVPIVDSSTLQIDSILKEAILREFLNLRDADEEIFNVAFFFFLQSAIPSPFFSNTFMFGSAGGSTITLPSWGGNFISLNLPTTLVSETFFPLKFFTIQEKVDEEIPPEIINMLKMDEDAIAIIDSTVSLTKSQKHYIIVRTEGMNVSYMTPVEVADFLTLQTEANFVDIEFSENLYSFDLRELFSSNSSPSFPFCCCYDRTNNQLLEFVSLPQNCNCSYLDIIDRVLPFYPIPDTTDIRETVVSVLKDFRFIPVVYFDKVVIDII